MPDRNPTLVALGHAVWQLREEQGLTPSGLATATGLDLARIEAIENGEDDPRYDVLLALADGLGVTKAALFNRAEELRGGARSRAGIQNTEEGGR